MLESKTRESFTEKNFKQSTVCLFANTDEHERILIILYVDDLIIYYTDEIKISTVIYILKEIFKVKNFYVLNTILESTSKQTLIEPFN